MKKVILIATIVFVLFLSYISFKHIWITNTVWEFERGVKMGEGDFIDFNGKMYSLKLNTIFRNGKKKSTVYKWDILKGEIWLKSINSNELGVYVDRDDH